MTTPSTLFQGAAALERFKVAIDRAFDDDATGETWATSRAPGRRPETTFVTDPADPRLLDGSFDMIVVDAGNSSGDEWKFVYHPATMTGVMIVETIAAGGSGVAADMLETHARA